jgi:hypothetical protein
LQIDAGEAMIGASGATWFDGCFFLPRDADAKKEIEPTEARSKLIDGLSQ